MNQMNASARNVRSFYARVSALGFGLISLTGVVALIAGLASGDTGSGVVFGLVFIVVGLLVAGAMWRFGRWALVLAPGAGRTLLALFTPSPRIGRGFHSDRALARGRAPGLCGFNRRHRAGAA